MLLPTPTEHLADGEVDAAYAWPDGPRLRVNMVASVDGAARAPDGLSHGISSDADRGLFGRLRRAADVVLVGASTVREEGYRPIRFSAEVAAAREADGRSPAPPIAVVTRSLSLDLSAPLFVEAPARTLVVTCSAADRADRDRAAEVADVLVCGDEDVDLARAVGALRERGLARVHSEGGPHLLGGLLAAGQVDDLLLTVSPVLAGGRYDARTDITRIVAGPALPGAPTGARLAHLLEEDGTLFARYTVEADGRG